MNITSAIMQRRTIRRFLQKPIDKTTLLELINLSRLYASGGNLQPIRYAAVIKQALLNDIFDTLRWAAYLPGFEIHDDQRPTAYVILTADAQSKKNCQFDLGAAATTLMLAAEEQGLGTCCLASFNRAKLIDILNLPENQEPLLVIALGYPAQQSKAVDCTDDIKYYENEEGCLCVPKRRLDDLLTLY